MIILKRQCQIHSKLSWQESCHERYPYQKLTYPTGSLTKHMGSITVNGKCCWVVITHQEYRHNSVLQEADMTLREWREEMLPSFHKLLQEISSSNDLSKWQYVLNKTNTVYVQTKTMHAAKTCNIPQVCADKSAFKISGSKQKHF